MITNLDLSLIRYSTIPICAPNKAQSCFVNVLTHCANALAVGDINRHKVETCFAMFHARGYLGYLGGGFALNYMQSFDEKIKGYFRFARGIS